MPAILFQIEVGRLPAVVPGKWRIQVSTTRRGVFMASELFPSKAEATRVARRLFRLNREADFDGKGLSQWTEER